ncbi:MAG: TIGR00730 family Rossman fold protein [Planctomycetes bacterium]|nr:TIGR00730 family Rossman fold protein [Planctomycetota bacterium]
MSLRALCVFCGSRSGHAPAHAAAARTLGTLLAERGIELVFGGGRVGLMGVLADAVLARGGRAIGVIPRALEERELGHQGLTRLHVVGTMHERKALMAELSQAFVALPGGFGTLEEICEAITWTQLGFHPKPCALLDVDGYWGPLAQLFDHALAQGFVDAQARALVLHEHDPARLLDELDRRVAQERG